MFKTYQITRYSSLFRHNIRNNHNNHNNVLNNHALELAHNIMEKQIKILVDLNDKTEKRLNEKISNMVNSNLKIEMKTNEKIEKIETKMNELENELKVTLLRTTGIIVTSLIGATALINAFG
jgi:hypothetical protein